MPRDDLRVHAEAPDVTAWLGPTNTGKTHHAVQRMLAHPTGMIGLPLRLLAREVYERVVTEKGAEHVALLTGEEKILPPRARWWVCTVESMPVDLPVAFLAVDEIQLAADPERGHVFTDRLLRARGVRETWFLGSDRMEGILGALVPAAVIRTRPRLSRLAYAGPRKLSTLPPRSAVVSFSVGRVYELAERLRARHGGVAVVLGALSPRVRNAQVELFQGGGVQHLVATDAIGMGLNMDVAHVALADVGKFDGRERRALRPDELAQIAGRAGRFRRDGTFGETGGIEPLDPAVVEAIEQHRFAPIDRVWWRNADLDFSSPDALGASLDAPPPRRWLVRSVGADDRAALTALLGRHEVKERLGGPAALRLLWEVCGVPDFGNVLPEHHAALLASLFVQLVDGHGTLSEDWLARQVARLDRADGDLDTLTARVAGIRIWTYVAHRSTWTSDPAAWQARTRAVEDALSDALHQRLVARFVDQRASVLVRHGPEGRPPTLEPDGVVRLDGAVLGRLSGLRFSPEPGARPSAAVQRAVWRLAAPLVAERLEDLLASPDGAFGVTDEGRVTWDGAEVARLVPGRAPAAPKVALLTFDGVDGLARGRLLARLEAWVLAWCRAGLERLHGMATEDPAARAIAFLLLRGGGHARRAELEGALAALTPAGKRDLVGAGTRLGAGHAWVPEAVVRVRERWIRWRVAGGPGWEGAAGAPRPPWRGRLPPRAEEVLGLVSAGGFVLRVDQADEVTTGGVTAALALGLGPEEAEAVASALAVVRDPSRARQPARRASRVGRGQAGRGRELP